MDTGEGIFRVIAEKLPFPTDGETRALLLRRRLMRMKTALTNVRPSIHGTLWQLRERGYRLCLVSNADCIDSAYWLSSPLAPLFTEAVFSHKAHLLKPDPAIYRLAAEKMGILPTQGLFVGDGGSEELRGAKAAGMKTVLTEYLLRRPPESRQALLRDADACMQDFSDLLKLLP